MAKNEPKQIEPASAPVPPAVEPPVEDGKQVADLKAQVAKLKKISDVAAADAAELRSQLAKLRDENIILKESLLRVETALDEAAKDAVRVEQLTSGDRVILGGVEQKIIARDTVKGMVEDSYKKRYVLEDQTCLVLDRHGS